MNNKLINKLTHEGIPKESSRLQDSASSSVTSDNPANSFLSSNSDFIDIPENHNNKNIGNPIDIIKSNSYLYSQYQDMRRKMSYNPEFLTRFEGFIERKATLPLLYDLFFKRLFNADAHRDRLTRLISCILGQEVTIVEILPTQNSQFYETFIIMDMIVRLSDGTIVNIEIQKIGSLFPGERLSCYSADTIMRQYHKLSSLKNDNVYNKYEMHTSYGTNASDISDVSNASNELNMTYTTRGFSYKEMKDVHTIVLLEKSSDDFRSPIGPEFYFHVSKHVFNTGIPLALLSHFHIISLDTFAKYRYADVIKGNVEITKYDYDEKMYRKPLTEKMLHDRLMYLSLFAISDINDVRKLLNVFPELADIFMETEEFLTRPEEVFSMFSEALRILDRNTTMLMVDEYRQQVTEMKEQLETKDEQLKAKKEEMETKDKELEEKDEQLKNAANEIAELKAKLAKVSNS